MVATCHDSFHLISFHPLPSGCIQVCVCVCIYHTAYSGLQYHRNWHANGIKMTQKGKGELLPLLRRSTHAHTHTRTHWHTQKKSDRALFAMRSTFFEGERSRTPLLIAVAYSSSIFGCQYIPIPSSLISLCLPLDTPLAPEAIQAIPNVSCVSFAKRSLLHLHEKRLRPRWWPNRFMI